MASAENKQQPAPAEVVERIVERYADSTLPTNPRQFVVLPPGDDDAAVQEKHELVSTAIDSIIEAARAREAAAAEAGTADNGMPPQDHQHLQVLVAISEIEARSDEASVTHLRSGVVTVSPEEANEILPQYAGEMATAVATLHELGHANLAQLDQQDHGYLDIADSDRLVSGWIPEIPQDILAAVRRVTNCEDLVPLPADKFESAANYMIYCDAIQAENKHAKDRAVRALHSIVHEAYADSFSILSIAIKDGAAKGSELAEALREFRIGEARRAGPEFDDHDSARGLTWLGSYLKTEQGQRLIATLSSTPRGDGTREDMIHQTALMFSLINLRRFAKDHGASPDQAEQMTAWVRDTFRREEVQLLGPNANHDSVAPEKTPKVYTYDKETIPTLGRNNIDQNDRVAHDAPQEERVLERTMKPSK